MFDFVNRDRILGAVAGIAIMLVAVMAAGCSPEEEVVEDTATTETVTTTCTDTDVDTGEDTGLDTGLATETTE